MKHICHISTTFNLRSGSARRTSAIINECVKQGFSTTLIVGKAHDLSEELLPGVNIYEVPQLIKYLNIFKDTYSLLLVTKIFKKIRPDIVHTHLAKAGILGRIAGKLAGVPKIVHTVHGPTFSVGIHPAKRFLYRSLERQCGRFTDHFVYVGEELRDEYVRSGVCPMEKTIIIRSGRPNSDFITSDGVKEEDIISLRKEIYVGPASFLIGYIGRLVPSKNQEAAIRVLKKVRDERVDADLVLVGEAHLREEKGYEKWLRKLAVDLDLAQHVHFTGYRPDVFLYMKAMDALILPSRYEGLPNVAIEAGITGRPMVAYDVCGVKEVLKEGVTGFVVPQGDEKAMADRLIFLARNPMATRVMGEKAGQSVRSIYTMDKMIEQKLKFYKSILSQDSH